VVVGCLLTLVKYWCLIIEDFCNILLITLKACDANKQHILFNTSRWVLHQAVKFSPFLGRSYVN
jgi:hypothetical protein